MRVTVGRLPELARVCGVTLPVWLIGQGSGVWCRGSPIARVYLFTSL